MTRPEVREAFYEQIFSKDGGFRFWLGNYNDLFKDPAANAEAYKFWRKKVLARVPDPEKATTARARKSPAFMGHEAPEPRAGLLRGRQPAARRYRRRERQPHRQGHGEGHQA
jgi:hypothetical protein